MAIDDRFIFDAMTSIVQPLERIIEDAQRFHMIPKKAMRVVCSWCQDAEEQTRLAHERGETVTHGLCPTCADRLEQETT